MKCVWPHDRNLSAVTSFMETLPDLRVIFPCSFFYVGRFRGKPCRYRDSLLEIPVMATIQPKGRWFFNGAANLLWRSFGGLFIVVVLPSVPGESSEIICWSLFGVLRRIKHLPFCFLQICFVFEQNRKSIFQNGFIQIGCIQRH